VSVSVEMVSGPAALFAALHGACFEETWSEAEFARLLALPNVCALIASDPAPIGFMLAWTAGDEAEVLTMGVAPASRRGGVARVLLQAATEALRGAGAETVFLEVRADNEAARALYAGAGFLEAGRRAGYYRGESPCDAIVMRCALNG